MASSRYAGACSIRASFFMLTNLLGGRQSRRRASCDAGLAHWERSPQECGIAGRIAGPTQETRRRILLDAGAGFGWLAASWLLQCDRAQAAEAKPHFAPKVKRVIQLFCVGGMSHLDTFDFKPDLQRLNGKPYEMPTFFGQAGNLFASPWAFKQRGQSGLWISDLLP